METLTFGLLTFGLEAGDEEREVGFGSEIKRPAADGGSFGVGARDGTFELPPEDGRGSCRASGVDERAKALFCGVSFRVFGAAAR